MDREVLDPLIAVMHQRLVRLAIVEGLLQGVERQIAPERRGRRQPTIRREKASTTNATYTKPRHVATYVRSATQS